MRTPKEIVYDALAENRFSYFGTLRVLARRYERALHGSAERRAYCDAVDLLERWQSDGTYARLYANRPAVK